MAPDIVALRHGDRVAKVRGVPFAPRVSSQGAAMPSHEFPGTACRAFFPGIPENIALTDGGEHAILTLSQLVEGDVNTSKSCRLSGGRGEGCAASPSRNGSPLSILVGALLLLTIGISRAMAQSNTFEEPKPLETPAGGSPETPGPPGPGGSFQDSVSELPPGNLLRLANSLSDGVPMADACAEADMQAQCMNIISACAAEPSCGRGGGGSTEGSTGGRGGDLSAGGGLYVPEVGAVRNVGGPCTPLEADRGGWAEMSADEREYYCRLRQFRQRRDSLSGGGAGTGGGTPTGSDTSNPPSPERMAQELAELIPGVIEAGIAEQFRRDGLPPGPPPTENAGSTLQAQTPGQATGRMGPQAAAAGAVTQPRNWTIYPGVLYRNSVDTPAGYLITECTRVSGDVTPSSCSNTSVRGTARGPARVRICAAAGGQTACNECSVPDGAGSGNCGITMNRPAAGPVGSPWSVLLTVQDHLNNPVEGASITGCSVSAPGITACPLTNRGGQTTIRGTGRQLLNFCASHGGRTSRCESLTTNPGQSIGRMLHFTPPAGDAGPRNWAINVDVMRPNNARVTGALIVQCPPAGGAVQNVVCPPPAANAPIHVTGTVTGAGGQVQVCVDVVEGGHACGTFTVPSGSAAETRRLNFPARVTGQNPPPQQAQNWTINVFVTNQTFIHDLPQGVGDAVVWVPAEDLQALPPTTTINPRNGGTVSATNGSFTFTGTALPNNTGRFRICANYRRRDMPYTQVCQNATIGLPGNGTSARPIELPRLHASLTINTNRQGAAIWFKYDGSPWLPGLRAVTNFERWQNFTAPTTRNDVPAGRWWIQLRKARCITPPPNSNEVRPGSATTMRIDFQNTAECPP